MKAISNLSVLLLLSVSGLIVAPAGCKGSDDSKAAKAPAEAPKPSGEPAPAPAPEPATEVKSEYGPEELWATVSSMSRMDIMEKFVDGVTVAGTISKINDDPVGEYGVEMDAGNGRVVELRFMDFGSAAKEKGLAAGAAVAATKCSVTNPKDDRMALVGCQLK